MTQSSGIRVNFSDKEAGSEARSVDVLPTGAYEAFITDISLEECGEESKNPGKPYWHLEFTVDSGPYENRKVWTNAMLFEGALYTVVQMCKAIGVWEEVEKTGDIPDAETFIGEKVVVNVQKMLDKYKMKDAPPGEKIFKAEVKSIAKFGVTKAGVGSAASKGNPLLP